ncbi:MAG: DUF4401 domain-containing protein, partial [Burkholderiales bacterium]|nr:DUF4401 domain-containing protein [Burkholderiales bacterium]
IPYQPNRFLSALAALIFVKYAALIWGVVGLFMPLCLISLAAVLHFQWRRPRFWPIVALALSLIPFFTVKTWGVLWSQFGNNALMQLPFWLPQVFLIIVWLGIVYTLLKQVTPRALSFENTGVWLLAFLLAAGTWPVPLALFALAVFFLGFSQRDKLLEGIGVVQLLWAVGYYYYALETTLLLKSLTLSVLGMALLLLYAVSRHLLPETRRRERT